MADITGTSGNDRLPGTDSADTIRGLEGNDTLIGGAGNDWLYGDSGDDIFDITASDFGTDRFFGGDGTDTIRLQANIQASSVLWNSSYLNSVEQLNFNYHTLSGTSGNDTIDISGFTSVSGYRTIDLSDGNDFFRGYVGVDYVNGGTGSDTLYGGAGDDYLTGGAGNDSLYGDSGNDTFNITASDFGTDRFFGGDGTDTIRLQANIQVSSVLWNSSYLNSVEQLNFNYHTLSGTTGNDTIDISGFSAIAGYRMINMGDGNDIFRGFVGADAVNGGTGSDTLYGGAGNDTLIGGAGNDSLYGDSGDDIFDITASDFGTDRFFGGDGTDTIRLQANIQVSSLLWNSSYLNSVEQLNFNYYSISGTSGNDRIDISGVSAIASYRTINMGEGNDVFVGFGGSDYVDGGAGNDTLNGGAGNDTLTGGAGNDVLNGGSGNDVFTITSSDFGTDKIDGGAGTDAIRLQTSIQVSSLLWNSSYLKSVEQLDFNYYNISGTTGNDRVDLSGFTTVSGYRMINLGDGNDVFIGYGGNDNVDAGAGKDTLVGGAGNDTLNGGAGVDTTSYAAATGAIKVDLRVATAQNIGGGQGNDVLLSIENLTGSKYADQLIGSGSANRLVGGAGNDTLKGLGGNDVLNGGAGNDRLEGGAGNDALTGAAGNDLLIGGAGNDTLNGGAGVDTASYETATGAIKVDLRVATAQNIGGGQGNDVLLSIENLTGSKYADQLIGSGSANRLVGGAGNDTLKGLAGNDALNGGAGNDRLEGGAGNDTLNGAAGKDLLTGGTGKDNLTGGTGADTFVFNTIQEAGKGATRDVITDFVSGTDTIQLSSIDANTSASGNQAFHWSGAQASAYGVWSVQSGGNRVVRGDVNGDGVFDFEIQLNGVSHLTADDFIL
ncbi:calcium-binding protein [Paracoccus sp. (in: a-proteobacteria)]|uniref:calcium-binding protein n=1 Tax=Paracoccus sp. TaxID=267 RepID=UPI002AFF34F2|nr:calcium-binding protein [Paracoccus sp. (in: a-proteobacteria)]